MPKKLSLFKSTASYKTYFDKASVVLGNTAAPEILSQMAFNLLEIQKEKEKEFELLELGNKKDVAAIRAYFLKKLSSISQRLV